MKGPARLVFVFRQVLGRRGGTITRPHKSEVVEECEGAHDTHTPAAPAQPPTSPLALPFLKQAFRDTGLRAPPQKTSFHLVSVTHHRIHGRIAQKPKSVVVCPERLPWTVRRPATRDQLSTSGAG
ncbi:hypothetical protein E2C01_035647 [Portunus trituberculatus]|uniref:Uncharacterized protein n=1 Tax=Portunus trituberculatus TaxID=210409 RepID=A0A5B7FC09_PORTR|nr:hypothetical protein [Portunus trituberculatus]